MWRHHLAPALVVRRRCKFQAEAGDLPSESVLVAIAAHGGLDAVMLTRLFDGRPAER